MVRIAIVRARAKPVSQTFDDRYMIFNLPKILNLDWLLNYILPFLSLLTLPLSRADIHDS